jgi:hypothetical protein
MHFYIKYEIVIRNSFSAILGEIFNKIGRLFTKQFGHTGLELTPARRTTPEIPGKCCLCILESSKFLTLNLVHLWTMTSKKKLRPLLTFGKKIYF